MAWRVDLRVEALILAGVCLVGAALHRVNLAVESVAVTERPAGDIGPLPDGRVVRVLSLGFERLVSDLFWIRTVYYMGDEHSEVAGFPAAERLAQLVTDIDPKFRTAYVIMAGGLEGLCGDPDAAIRLLEKGVANVAYWKLHFMLGFAQYFHRADYAAAAASMQRASELGGPPYLPLLSSRLYANAGDPATGMLLVRKRLEQASSPEDRATLERRYAALWVRRDLAALDAAVASYTKQRGKAPTRIGELVQAGLLPAEPHDPAGGTYRIASGRAVTDIPTEALDLHESAHPVGWKRRQSQ